MRLDENHAQTLGNSPKSNKVVPYRGCGLLNLGLLSSFTFFRSKSPLVSNTPQCEVPKLGFHTMGSPISRARRATVGCAPRLGVYTFWLSERLQIVRALMRQSGSLRTGGSRPLNRHLSQQLVLRIEANLNQSTHDPPAP